ncbi:hypothetical protein [Pseudoalteromonas sp. KAN5]|uniref:hypothetical protein n=1 Tax=Pseudoalteromonas sp. KAN5 TaxID=2916633 RepID=UPI001FCB360E|nr:hypothetical protein [Pseudoalteromonas sp. KAN5]
MKESLNIRCGIEIPPVCNYQLSAISYQLSAISYQLSAISYQLSAISYQLSAISYQLSAISYQLKIKKPCLLSQAWFYLYTDG